MAKPELILSITLLSKKIDNLLSKQQMLMDRVKQLEKQNEELKVQHNQDLLFLKKANQEIEFLSMSHRLASSPEALVDARNKITGLIRTIDNCIRMIKEE